MKNSPGLVRGLIIGALALIAFVPLADSSTPATAIKFSDATRGFGTAPASNEALIYNGSTLAGGTLSVAGGGTGGTTDANARTNLGLAIGSNVQAWDSDLDTLSGYTILTQPTISGASYTSTLTRGRRYNLLAADIADLVTNPPTGWSWVNSTNTISSANISSGVLTINADTSHSYNTPSANPVLYPTNLPPNATVTMHCSCSGNESFEGCFLYFSESRGGTDGVRIGPAGSDCDLEAYDGSVSVKPVAMACDDWWWLKASVTDNQIRWWLQTNGATDSSEPTAVGSDVTSTWVYEGQTSVTTRKGAFQMELGVGILRIGPVSGSFRMRCNAMYIDTPGTL